MRGRTLLMRVLFSILLIFCEHRGRRLVLRTSATLATVVLRIIYIQRCTGLGQHPLALELLLVV